MTSDSSFTWFFRSSSPLDEAMIIKTYKPSYAKLEVKGHMFGNITITCQVTIPSLSAMNDSTMIPIPYIPESEGNDRKQSTIIIVSVSVVIAVVLIAICVHIYKRSTLCKSKRKPNQANPASGSTQTSQPPSQSPQADNNFAVYVISSLPRYLRPKTTSQDTNPTAVYVDPQLSNANALASSSGSSALDQQASVSRPVSRSRFHTYMHKIFRIYSRGHGTSSHDANNEPLSSTTIPSSSGHPVSGSMQTESDIQNGQSPSSMNVNNNDLYVNMNRCDTFTNELGTQ